MATYEIKNASSTSNINSLDKTIFDRDYSKKTTYQMIIKLCNTITLKILIMT